MRRVEIDNRYRVLKKLGAGAMGDVYKVRDLNDNKILALKMLSKQQTSSEAVQRFKREFSLLAGLHHPNLCPVYDFGMLQDGRSYFTMEYIDGLDIFNATQGLGYQNIYPWVVQLCRVLEYIHAKGLIHYDIKPSNVFIHMPNGRIADAVVKLMDFGLAGEQRIKSGLIIKGTFPYIAPEVIDGSLIDHRADFYSLGILLYEIFTRRPFRSNQSFESLPKISFILPRNLKCSIVKLLSFKPTGRYNRANEIIKEINRFSGSRFEIETEKTIEGYLLSSKFVGREKEMNLLRALHERARQGKGKVVLVTGETGVGKSRLLKEFKNFAQLKRSSCFIGHAYRDRPIALAPFFEIFRELIHHLNDGSKFKTSLAVLFNLFPDLVDGHLRMNLPKLVPLDPELEKLRNFNALTELIKHIASGLGELVILLEDIHWADHLSIQFLEYLGRNFADRNILICATCRKDEVAVNPWFKVLAANLRTEGCFLEIKLRPLKFKSLYSFLDSTITSHSNSAELARYLMDKTGGNPFFVEEIMRTLLQKRIARFGEKLTVALLREISIPNTIEDVILKRIDDLDQTSLQVVKYAAVLHKDFKYDLMKRVTGLNDTDLSRILWELKRTHVLVEEGNRYHFSHTSLEETLIEKLGQRDKKRLNYRVGKIIEHFNKKNKDSVIEDLAYYFINARDYKKGIRYGLRAAQKSKARYAYEQAIRFYRGVLDLLAEEDIARRFIILQELASVERYVYHYEDAIRHYEHALRLKIGTAEKKAKILLNEAGIYLKTGKYADAFNIYRRTTNVIKGIEPGMLKSLLTLYVGVIKQGIYFQLGEYNRVDSSSFDLKKSGKWARTHDNIRMLVDIYHNLGALEIYKGRRSKIDYSKAIYYYKEVYKHSKKIRALDKIPVVLNNLGICYYQKFDYPKALRCYQKAIRISEKIGDQYTLLHSLLNVGIILKDQGYYSKAIDYFGQALGIAQKINNISVIGASQLGLGACYLETCEYQRAKGYYEQALRIFHVIGWRGEQSFLIRGFGNIQMAIGNYESALRFYRRALKISRELGYNLQIANLLINIASVYFEIGKSKKAQRYIIEALGLGTNFGIIDIEIDSHIFLCHIHILDKKLQLAQQSYRKAMALVKNLKLRRPLIELHLLIAEINKSIKKYKRGIKMAEKAIALARTIGQKELYAQALLIKSQNEIKLGRSNRRIFAQLDEARRIAEEINAPEVLWKCCFEYGQLLQEGNEYLKSLEYYAKCMELFKGIIGKFQNESYKQSYLNRPDRKAVIDIIKGI